PRGSPALVVAPADATAATVQASAATLATVARLTLFMFSSSIVLGPGWDTPDRSTGCASGLRGSPEMARTPGRTLSRFAGGWPRQQKHGRDRDDPVISRMEQRSRRGAERRLADSNCCFLNLLNLSVLAPNRSRMR